jgi:hypothetical protein
LRYLSYNEDLTGISSVQDVVLVRRFRERKHNSRAFKLKNLEEEGIMVA